MTFLLQANGLGGNFFLLAMLAVIVFTMIVPQFQRSRKQKKFLESLEKGNRVVTTSGFLGTIDKIEGNIVTLNLGNKTYVQVTKNAISRELTDAIYAQKTDK